MKVLTIVAKGLRIFSRDRPALFWTFAFPLLLITVFSLAFSGQGSVRIKVLVVQQDNSRVGSEYLSALKNVLDVEMVENIQEAEAKVFDGKVVAAIIIPMGFGAREENARLIYDETRGELATAVVRIVEGITQGFFGLQVSLTVKSVRGGYKKWNPVQQYVPGMGIMMVLMIGGIGVSTRIITERKTGTFRRNLLAPIGKLTFLGGELLSGFIIGCMQIIVFFGVGILVFGLEIAGNILLVALISAFVILMGVGLGLLVSTFARSADAATGTVQAFVFPAAALGGLWFPIEIMPGFMQSIAKVFPTYHSMNAFQDVIVRGKGLLEIMPSLMVVIAFVLAFLVSGLLLFKWRE
jgi:ABC-2 type transport system permease protein